MPSWSQVAADAPDFATKVMAAFDAHKHKVLATLRADGSPRVSGTELALRGDDLWLGSMLDARKARDLLRDPRFALHSGTVDVELARVPDVKIAGTAVAASSPEELAVFAGGEEGMDPSTFHLFRLDITEVVCTWVADDLIHVESWHPGRGVQLVSRA